MEAGLVEVTQVNMSPSSSSSSASPASSASDNDVEDGNESSEESSGVPLRKRSEGCGEEESGSGEEQVKLKEKRKGAGSKGGEGNGRKEGSMGEKEKDGGSKIKGKSKEGKGHLSSSSTSSSSTSLGGGAGAASSRSRFKSFKPPANWVDAPVFVPRWMAPVGSSLDDSKSGDSECVGSNDSGSDDTCGGSLIRSYAQVVGPSILDPNQALALDSTSELCPYAMVGECRYGFKCVLVHGLKCDYCGQSCLHPSDAAQRHRHTRECVEQHERDMELSFAVARSIDKVCGVCYEKVMSKNPPGEQRFGILPSCNHIFCLSCIRRWRQERQFDNKTIRACPECRITSDFVCPSRYWVDNKEEKDKLIGSYKVALSKKPCRYYRSGEGQCPFGNKCFYLHALPDGTVVDVGPPRRVSGAQGTRSRPNAQTLSIWEYIEEWEMQWLDLEDFMGMFDSDTASEFSFPDVDVDLDGDDELYLDWDRM